MDEKNPDFVCWAEPPRTDGPRAYCIKDFENYVLRLRLKAELPEDRFLNTAQQNHICK